VSRAFFSLAAYRLETSETIRHGSPLLAGRIEGGALGQIHAFGKWAPSNHGFVMERGSTNFGGEAPPETPPDNPHPACDPALIVIKEN
jgi:hypothetical protein